MNKPTENEMTRQCERKRTEGPVEQRPATKSVAGLCVMVGESDELRENNCPNVRTILTRSDVFDFRNASFRPLNASGTVSSLYLSPGRPLLDCQRRFFSQGQDVRRGKTVCPPAKAERMMRSLGTATFGGHDVVPRRAPRTPAGCILTAPGTVQPRVVVPAIFCLLISLCIVTVDAFGMSAPPALGLGAIFLRPGMKTVPSLGEEEKLAQAADFFTEAFWTKKIGGGARSLSARQRKSLYQSQLTEFRRRYGRRVGNIGGDRRAELLICTNSRGCVGVAGIEVDRIPKHNLQSSSTLAKAPLMSNVAVGRKFRRRGIAEELVAQIETMIRKEWGYDECYLYVEKINTPAIRLYRKLGYKKVWEDPRATTLLPTQKGTMKNAPTTIVCMRKRLRGGIFGRWFS